MSKASCDKGVLFLCGDCAIYVGQPLAPDTHSHYATQLGLSIGSRLKLITEKHPSQIQCDGVVIAKNLEHSIECNAGVQLLMFVDNNVLTLSSLLKGKGDSDAFSDQIMVSFQKPSVALAASIHNSLNSKDPSVYFHRLKEQLLCHFGLSIKQSANIDSRIEKLLNWFNSGQKLTESGEQLADGFELSESRLQHLFKEEVGIPIRRYLLWMRLKNAVYDLTSGLNLTEAAYNSGFSDSAHFSRTFKSMFGITPSSVFSSKNKLEVYVLKN